MMWQEAVVGAIVTAAVVMLYRRLRAAFATQPRSGRPSCHGCDDCDG